MPPPPPPRLGVLHYGTRINEECCRQWPSEAPHGGVRRLEGQPLGEGAAPGPPLQARGVWEQRRGGHAGTLPGLRASGCSIGWERGQVFP